MLVGVATNLLSERQIWGCVCHEELLEDEADEWLSIQYLVPKSVAEISELGWEFARRMSVMELPELADRYVNVMFLPKVEEGA